MEGTANCSGFLSIKYLSILSPTGYPLQECPVHHFDACAVELAADKRRPSFISGDARLTNYELR